MTLDATFWVTISFFIFIGILFYLKVPQKVIETLELNISNISNQIGEAEKLKEDAKNILIEQEKRISNSKNEVKEMIDKANEEAEKNVIKTLESNILNISNQINEAEKLKEDAKNILSENEKKN